MSPAASKLLRRLVAGEVRIVSGGHMLGASYDCGMAWLVTGSGGVTERTRSGSVRGVCFAFRELLRARAVVQIGRGVFIASERGEYLVWMWNLRGRERRAAQRALQITENIRIRESSS